MPSQYNLLFYSDQVQLQDLRNKYSVSYLMSGYKEDATVFSDEHSERKRIVNSRDTANYC